MPTRSPPALMIRPFAIVEVAVVEEILSVETESPPKNVEVAFVEVAKSAEITGVEVPVMRVPSKDSSALFDSVEALVPPLPTGNMPETWDVNDACPESVPNERQLLATAKQPFKMFRPPFAETNVDVAVVKFAILLTEKSVPGVVVPMPTFPPKYALPVVVEPPEIVNPPAAVPSPIVEEAVDKIPPEKVSFVDVASPVNGYPNTGDGSA